MLLNHTVTIAIVLDLCMSSFIILSTTITCCDYFIPGIKEGVNVDIAAVAAEGSSRSRGSGSGSGSDDDDDDDDGDEDDRDDAADFADGGEEGEREGEAAMRAMENESKIDLHHDSYRMISCMMIGIRNAVHTRTSV